MTRTRWQTLVALAVGTLAVAVLALLVADRAGAVLPAVPWTVSLVLVLLGGIVLWMGRAVRQYLAGKRPDLNPLRAARTAVLAKAAAYTGALLAGWYGAQVVVVLDDLEIEALRRAAVAAGLAALAAAALCVVGLVVEGFCRLPPPSSEDGAETDREPTPA